MNVITPKFGYQTVPIQYSAVQPAVGQSYVGIVSPRFGDTAAFTYTDPVQSALNELRLGIEADNLTPLTAEQLERILAQAESAGKAGTEAQYGELLNLAFTQARADWLEVICKHIKAMENAGRIEQEMVTRLAMEMFQRIVTVNNDWDYDPWGVLANSSPSFDEDKVRIAMVQTLCETGVLDLTRQIFHVTNPAFGLQALRVDGLTYAILADSNGYICEEALNGMVPRRRSGLLDELDSVWSDIRHIEQSLDMIDNTGFNQFWEEVTYRIYPYYAVLDLPEEGDIPTLSEATVRETLNKKLAILQERSTKLEAQLRLLETPEHLLERPSARSNTLEEILARAMQMREDVLQGSIDARRARQPLSASAAGPFIVEQVIPTLRGLLLGDYISDNPRPSDEEDHPYVPEGAELVPYPFADMGSYSPYDQTLLWEPFLPAVAAAYKRQLEAKAQNA